MGKPIDTGIILLRINTMIGSVAESKGVGGGGIAGHVFPQNKAIRLLKTKALPFLEEHESH